jgi:hypothetical protein
MEPSGSWTQKEMLAEVAVGGIDSGFTVQLGLRMNLAFMRMGWDALTFVNNLSPDQTSSVGIASPVVTSSVISLHGTEGKTMREVGRTF